MSNPLEANGYKIIGPVPIGPIQGRPDSAVVGSPYPGVELDRSGSPIEVRPEPTCSQRLTQPKGNLTQIRHLGSQLIAAARREAGQIVADAVEEAEAVARRADQSCLARVSAIEAETILRLANIRDSFIQATAAELFELVETAIVAVVGELITPPSTQTLFPSSKARTNQSADYCYGRLLRSRISRALSEHLPGSPAQIFIHPEDYEILVRDDCTSMPTIAAKTTKENAASNSPSTLHQFFVCDSSLQRGGARIRTDFGAVEISLPRQLDMVLDHISTSMALRDSLIAFLEAEDA